MTKGKVTTCLNVDVEVRSTASLKELSDHLSKSVFMLSSEDLFIAFEAHLDPPYTLDDLIRALAKIVEALPPQLRDVWDCCDSRRFDIGIEAGDQPPSKLSMFPMRRSIFFHASAPSWELRSIPLPLQPDPKRYSSASP
jgi:hypothetical protein